MSVVKEEEFGPSKIPFIRRKKNKINDYISVWKLRNTKRNESLCHSMIPPKFWWSWHTALLITPSYTPATNYSLGVWASWLMRWFKPLRPLLRPTIEPVPWCTMCYQLRSLHTVTTSEWAGVVQINGSRVQIMLLRRTGTGNLFDHEISDNVILCCLLWREKLVGNIYSKGYKVPENRVGISSKEICMFVNMTLHIWVLGSVDMLFLSWKLSSPVRCFIRYKSIYLNLFHRTMDICIVASDNKIEWLSFILPHLSSFMICCGISSTLM